MEKLTDHTPPSPPLGKSCTLAETCCLCSQNVACIWSLGYSHYSISEPLCAHERFPGNDTITKDSSLKTNRKEREALMAQYRLANHRLCGLDQNPLPPAFQEKNPSNCNPTMLWPFQYSLINCSQGLWVMIMIKWNAYAQSCKKKKLRTRNWFWSSLPLFPPLPIIPHVQIY